MLEELIFLLVFVPMFAVGAAGAVLSLLRSNRRARHRVCLDNIDRLERELEIVPKPPSTIRYLNDRVSPYYQLGSGAWSRKEHDRDRRALAEYLKIVDDLPAPPEPKPHFLEYKDGAEYDWKST